MKRIKKLSAFTPHIVNGATAREMAVPEAPLPPAPPQMNNPVGPPPGEPVLPVDFAGYIDLAKKVSRGALTDKAQLWATMALATAMNRQADLLEELVTFFYPEETEKSEGVEGEPVPSRASEAIADGIGLAFSGIVAGSSEVQSIIAKIGKK